MGGKSPRDHWMKRTHSSDEEESQRRAENPQNLEIRWGVAEGNRHRRETCEHRHRQEPPRNNCRDPPECESGNNAGKVCAKSNGGRLGRRKPLVSNQLRNPAEYVVYRRNVEKTHRGNSAGSRPDSRSKQ